MTGGNIRANNNNCRDVFQSVQGFIPCNTGYHPSMNQGLFAGPAGNLYRYN